MDSKKENTLLRRLQKISEYSFLEGLRHDVTPYVMGALPDDVEAQRQKCYGAGISKEKVDKVIGVSWTISYNRHYSRRSKKAGD